MTEDHRSELNQSINLFLHAPLLSLKENLVTLSGKINTKEWSDKIGFSMNPYGILRVPDILHAYVNFF